MLDRSAELVRIDETGHAHAIGKLASQRLRQHVGAYRILPSPQHVVFMRYTGEDGRRDEQDGAIVRLAGEVTHPGTLCDIFALLGHNGWRGELHVLDGQIKRSLYFEQGNILGVTTSVPEERIGAVLRRFGVITAEQHTAIMQRVSEGARFGDSAVQLGFLTQEQVYANIRRQVQEVTFAALMTSDGTFFFLDGFDESRLASRQAIGANALLMDAATRMDEMRYFRVKIPSKEHVPARAQRGNAPSSELLACYEAVDGRRSIDEIGRYTATGEFDVTKQIYGLVQSGHVVIRPPRLSGGPRALVETANDVLRLAHGAMTDSSRLETLRESLAAFAVGAGMYDLLFRDAGPNPQGELDAEKVSENSVLVSTGTDPEQMLKQLLYEYVSFALFSAGGLLGSSTAEEQLKRQVAGSLAVLHSSL